MTVYKYHVWKDEEVGVREILVVAPNEERAREKLEDSNVEFDDYDFYEDDEYDAVII
jgi:hypothetical protein